MTNCARIEHEIGTVSVYQEAAAERLLASSEFQAQWQNLFEKCPWGTCFQTSAFVCTWYRCYGELYQPLLLVRFAANGQMDGLLTLAVDRTTGDVTFAGAHHAEYRVWLALPGEQTFIVDALEQLRRLGFVSLSFAYLPPRSPTEWLQGQWAQSVIVRRERKPFMDVGDGADPQESLRKKRNKKRMGRFQRAGALEFLQLTSPEELDWYYEDIIVFTDFRHGALHNSYPFAGDPRKRLFFRELMRSSGLMHVTVMRAGGCLASAHLGFKNRNEVTLGLLCYSPFFSDHSPGKFHILQLALLLHQQGISRLDLTPGGDSYKDRFATGYEEVSSMTVFFDARALARRQVGMRSRSYAKRAALALGLERANIARYESLLRKAASNPVRAARSIMHMLKRRVWGTTEMRFYRLRAGEISQQIGDPAIMRDSLRDLLCYEPAEAIQSSKQQFLRAAMSRIEAGRHVYTHVQEGRLVHYGWLTTREIKSLITEVGCEYAYPHCTAVMWDFYTFPSSRGQGWYSRSLRHILSDVAAIAGTEYVYIAVLANNWPSRRVIEEVGFKYHNSIVRITRFGSDTYKLD